MTDYDGSGGLEDIVKARDKLLKEISSWDKKIKDLQDSKFAVYRKVAEANKVLKNLCKHDWIRESYMYSPLYCKICGVER